MLPDGRALCEPSALRSVSMPAARPGLTPEQISAIDAAHLWHPYSTIGSESVTPVVAGAARGAWLTLIRDGKPIEARGAAGAIAGGDHPARSGDGFLQRLRVGVGGGCGQDGVPVLAQPWPARQA